MPKTLAAEALTTEAQLFFVPYFLPTDQELLARFDRQRRAINQEFAELCPDRALELTVMFPEGVLATAPRPFHISSERGNGIGLWFC